MQDFLVEEISKIEHEQWAHWTEYMLDKMCGDEDFVASHVERWRRQIKTPYSELTEEEKESDRAWAKKTLQRTFEIVSRPSRISRNIITKSGVFRVTFAGYDTEKRPFPWAVNQVSDIQKDVIFSADSKIFAGVKQAVLEMGGKIL